MVLAADPVRRGFIQSFARPGGNITGLASVPGEEHQGKLLQLLKEIVPRLALVGVFAQKAVGFDPATLETLARQLGLRLEVNDQLQKIDEIEDAFAEMKRKQIDAYLVVGGAVLFPFRERIMTGA